MFNPKNLINEYHKLQQHEQEVAARGNPPPPASRQRDSPSFNPLQFIAYLSQLDLTNPPPALKNSLKNPIVLVGIAIFLWLLIGLLTKLIFIGVVGGVAYFLLKGTGGNGGDGPVEDVVGKRPPFPHQSTSNTSQSQSPYPSPGAGSGNPQQPKDLASFLWQKGVPAGIELAQTFLHKRTREEATKEIRTNRDNDN
ncbi:hypothetical protein JCM5350_003163 [Sporobolomyces pararoseus]